MHTSFSEAALMVPGPLADRLCRELTTDCEWAAGRIKIRIMAEIINLFILNTIFIQLKYLDPVVIGIRDINIIILINKNTPGHPELGLFMPL